MIERMKAYLALPYFTGLSWRKKGGMEAITAVINIALVINVILEVRSGVSTIGETSSMDEG